MDAPNWQAVLQSKLSRRGLLSLVASAGVGGALLACSGDDEEAADAPAPGSTGVERPEGWTQASHSNDADPDYAVVFPQDRVSRMTFTVTPENWQAMLDNMTALAGARGIGPGGPVQAGAGGPGDYFTENPMWVPATVGFNGLEWTNVGLRFKGNSSLRSAWGEGTDRMPFKLDFDEFEDDFPTIDNQRFYGFKQLSLSTNWNDPAGLRESLVSHLMEEAGLPVARTGFYEIVLDYGDGPTSLGLYTVIEVVDDTVIPRLFDDDDGNIYEAEGPGASFAEGTRGQIEASFQVESDEEQADWSDLRALYDVLHSGQRLSDPGAWRAALEAVFNVEPFLRWLALSALLQHWDAYGFVSHNYYLYNDPDTGLLNWITWDHNLVLGASGGAGRPAGVPWSAQGREQARHDVAFDKRTLGPEWPLITYLIDQPEYAEKYNAYLRELLDGVFEPASVKAWIEAQETLLAPFAGEQGPAYAAAVDALIAAVEERATAAEAYLDGLQENR